MTRDEQEDALRAELDAMGVEYDGRWGVEKLQETLDAAKPPEAPAPQMVTCMVLRDFWPTENQADRVRKGQIVDVTVEQALDGVESGALKRVR
jgi:hypothetical protein